METRRTVSRCCYCGAQWSDARIPLECPECGSYATVLRTIVRQDLGPALSIDASKVEARAPELLSTGDRAWDQLLSGGLSPGSTVLVYGRPGAMKTTRLGALADSFATTHHARALFISAEQPSWDAQTLIARVRRPRALYILGLEQGGSRLDRAQEEIARLRPNVVVWDSLQCFEDSSGARHVASTIAVVRGTALRTGHVALLVSRVNARGAPEGPRRSIHECDVVVRLSKTRAAIDGKNRFGPPRAIALSASRSSTAAPRSRPRAPRRKTHLRLVKERAEDPSHRAPRPRAIA